jgi:DNA-binding transcriptional LysR family regulator
MMNLMHWRLLVAVADAGNITRAAERVGMTQSGASQALGLLEDMLGVQLFTRENRQTLPTAIGLQVIEQARLMLGALETIRTTVDAAKDIQRGTIRLASFPMVLATFLPPLLRQFNQLYPGIQVVALEVSDDEVETLLSAGLIDLGVVLNPSAERNAGLLGRDNWVAVLPIGHALARRPGEASVSLAELIEQPFVLATGGCSVNARSLAADAGLELLDVRVEVREWSSAFTLVRKMSA